MSEAEARGKAARAKAHLAAYGEATNQIRIDLMKGWLETDQLEIDKREAIWRAVKTLDMVSDAMNASISSGEVLDHRAATRHILGEISG